jgi:hypothetical protein
MSTNKFLLKQYSYLFNKKVKNIINMKKNTNVSPIYIKNVLNIANSELDNDEINKIKKKMEQFNINKCDIFYGIVNKNNNDKLILTDYKQDIIELKKENKNKNKNKRKRSISPNNDWVSASKVRNHILKDPILDWLSYHPNKKQRIGPNTNYNKTNLNLNLKMETRESESFTSYIQNKGIEFEDVVIKAIRRLFPKDIIQIANTGWDSLNVDKYQETIDAMDKGIPIIYQGVLHDNIDQTFGIPDLIVRSDFINKLVKTEVMTRHDSRHSGIPNKNYHYVIIDIKMCTMNLTADGEHLLNSGSVPAFKGQVYIYNRALGQIQNYVPSCAYILGKAWTYKKGKIKYENNECFDKLGVIDYTDFDNKYVDLTDTAIKWIRQMRTDGHKWSTSDSKTGLPTVPELYPNMSNQMDGRWHSVKQQIANEICEITQIWNCGPENREIAHDQGIYSWKDKKCNAYNLGFRGKKQGPIVDAILKINKSKSKLITKNIKNNFEDWQKNDNLELFVDFETMSSICSDFKEENDTIVNNGFNMIFMVGLGYIKNGDWHFETFLAKDHTISSEKKMLDQFYNYVNNIKKNEYPKMYHWGHAERTLFNSAISRHGEGKWRNLKWFDMLEVFKAEPIVINGCFNFGLKSIAKTMYRHNMINVTWNSNNKCSNGQNAMIYAYNEYNKYKKLNEPITNSDVIGDIAEYNEIDCKVIYEIVEYLRHNCLK